MFTRAVILLIICLGLNATIEAQTDWSKYRHVKTVEFSSVPQLAAAITAGFESDRAKVEAIYYWVTNNIEYDQKLFLRNKEKAKKKKAPRYTGAALAIYEQEMTLSALRSGKGVCEHYALIFRDLCRKVDIEAEIIVGYGKVNPLKTKSSGIKHAWNAVKLDHDWYLFDPTWGSGYVTQGDKFVTDFNGDYAFVAPEAFLMNHFPKEAQWQLTQNRIDRTGYRSVPVIGPGYLRYQLNNLTPANNVIEVKQGDTVLIQFTSPLEILEIKTRNIKSNEVAPTILESDGEDYEVGLVTDTLQSGNYSFYSDRKLLFTYRITVGRRLNPKKTIPEK